MTSGSSNTDMMILGNYANENSEVQLMREEKVKMNEKLDEFAAMLQ